MRPRIRDGLPVLVGLLWLYLSWRFLWGAPSLREALALWRSGEVAQRYSGFDAFAWLAGLFAAMVAVDWLWRRLARRREVDRMTLHWSRLRNHAGSFTCAACRGVFLLPPEDLSDEGWVRCGDCGHAVAPYGEMKPHLAGHGGPRLRWRGWFPPEQAPPPGPRPRRRRP